MNLRNLTAFFLASLFLLNLLAFQSNGLLQVLTGKEVTVVHPFCKKAKNSFPADDSFTIDHSSVNSLEIAIICTPIIDLKTTTYSLIFAENNFKEYGFSDNLHLNHFSEPFLFPPRV